MLRKVAWLVAFAAGTSFAASVQLPGATLTVPGTSATGTSFTFTGTLTGADTITLTQSGNPCLQGPAAYCTNGAGVLTVAGSSPVGAAASFSGPAGVIPAGTWTFGSLLMSISGVGTVQIFPTNAAAGLGSPTPPASLTLPATTLSALGFGTFTQTNPTIRFIVADTNFADNGGQFVLAQAAPPVVAAPPIPTLGEWAVIALTLLLAGLGAMRLRRGSRPTGS
jgi:exosortase sorting signal-containing protein